MKAGYLVIAMLAVATVFGLGCQSGSNSASGSNNPVVTQASPAATPPAGTETVRIDSPDKVVIVGTYYEADKPNSPALLLLHQWQSDRHSYDEFAKRMQAKGFAVLSIDGRGFGESTKKADGSTISAGRTDADVKAMLGDVGAAYDFLAKQKNVDASSIGIAGASYGSSLAILYATENRKVGAVALVSPGLNYFGNMPIEPAMKKYGDRFLCVIAAEDDKDSADAIRKLNVREKSPNWYDKIYPAGGHGTALFRVKGGLEEELESFFMGMVLNPNVR